MGKWSFMRVTVLNGREITKGGELGRKAIHHTRIEGRRAGQ